MEVPRVLARGKVSANVQVGMCLMKNLRALTGRR